MPLLKLTKTIAFVALSGLSAHAASAQAVLDLLPPPVFDQQGPAVDLSHTANLLNNSPQLTLPGHVNIPGTGANHGHNAPRHHNGNAADAVGALIGLGIVAGAIHAANQPRTRSVRIECPQGTQATATPIGSGAGGVVLDGYRWICTY